MKRKELTFTRLRLSSHNLKIEKGRWSRIVREARLCQCGNAIEDETHVLFDCPKTVDIRDRFGIMEGEFNTIGEFMDRYDPGELVNFIDYCMRRF